MIGNLRIGSYENVELEAALSKKPVISFVDKNIKIIIDNSEIDSPFLPNDNDPKSIAKTIDKIVLDTKFREKISEEGYNFAKKIGDPKISAEWWDLFFEDLIKKNIKINRNSNKFLIKLRMILFLIANRTVL